MKWKRAQHLRKLCVWIGKYLCHTFKTQQAISILYGFKGPHNIGRLIGHVLVTLNLFYFMGEGYFYNKNLKPENEYF